MSSARRPIRLPCSGEICICSPCCPIVDARRADSVGCSRVRSRRYECVFAGSCVAPLPVLPIELAQREGAPSALRTTRATLRLILVPAKALHSHANPGLWTTCALFCTYTPLSFGRPQCAACAVHRCERRGQLPFCSAVSAFACSGWSSSSNDRHWNVRLHLADCTAVVKPCAAPLRMRTDMSTTERHPGLYQQGESKGSR